jgi:diguanylate cyclase (GGDEF)-like protein
MIDSATQPLLATAATPRAQEQRALGKRQQLLQSLLKNNELLLKNRLEVRHLMTPDPVVVPPSMPLDEMTVRMQQRRLHHLLVCNRSGEVLGVVSDRNLHTQHGATAQQLMSYPVLSVTPETPLSAAITYLLNANVSCLPVVDNGQLCGVLTSTDMLLALQCMLQLWLRLSQVLQHDAAWTQDVHRANLVDLRADALTGMSSRRGLEEVLDMLLAINQRFSQPFSLAVVVIDHFHHINEICGEDVARSLVKMAARLIERAVRSSDFAGRIREDAFAVLMPQTALDEAEHFCQRLREAARKDVELDGALRISAAAVAPESGEDSPQLIKRAEAAVA